MNVLSTVINKIIIIIISEMWRDLQETKIPSSSFNFQITMETECISSPTQVQRIENQKRILVRFIPAQFFIVKIFTAHKSESSGLFAERTCMKCAL